MLTIVEHSSSSYGPRTFHNATLSHLTVRFAVDFNTAGEKLTERASGGGIRLLDVPLPCEALDPARALYARLKRLDAEVLNIAGNGIYSMMEKGGLDQAQVNQMVYDVIKLCHKHYPITIIRSGGQTGADLAGGVAGYKLGIPTIMTFPKGFRQRDVNKQDANHTEEEIREQVIQQSACLA